MSAIDLVHPADTNRSADAVDAHRNGVDAMNEAEALARAMRICPDGCTSGCAHCHDVAAELRMAVDDANAEPPDPQLDLWISPSEIYTDPIAAARLRVAVRRLRWMRTLSRELVDRCDGEPHCHSCIFCGAMERGEHGDACPWPKLVAEVRV